METKKINLKEVERQLNSVQIIYKRERVVISYQEERENRSNENVLILNNIPDEFYPAGSVKKAAVYFPKGEVKKKEVKNKKGVVTSPAEYYTGTEIKEAAVLYDGTELKRKGVPLFDNFLAAIKKTDVTAAAEDLIAKLPLGTPETFVLTNIL